MKTVLFAVLSSLASSLSASVALADNNTACYAIEVQSPAGTPLDITSSKEIWCYHQLEHPKGATYVYRGDGEEVVPESAAVLEKDGFVTHASLMQGKRTIHRLKADFNPLGVPMTPPVSGAIQMNLFSKRNDVKFKKSADEVLKLLLDAKPKPVSLQIREGTFSSSNFSSNAISPDAADSTFVKAEYQPWRGYWWPYSAGKLHAAGSESPLGKFDRFTAARGAPTAARNWEITHHAYTGISWQGHCNAWAASAILRPEPQAPYFDEVSGITFSVSDQKGLLAAKDNCVQAAFFGNRYNGWRRDEDIEDVYPADFHNAVLYYIGQLKKPIALDRLRTAAVDNQVASAFETKIVRKNDYFDVTTTLRMHAYDFDINEKPGVAGYKDREFKYRLWIGPSGEVTRGEWITKNNPDFLWIPLHPRPCPVGNPHVSAEWINTLFGYTNP